jgi:hypothetical protein
MSTIEFSPDELATSAAESESAVRVLIRGPESQPHDMETRLRRARLVTSLLPTMPVESRKRAIVANRFVLQELLDEIRDELRISQDDGGLLPEWLGNGTPRQGVSAYARLEHLRGRIDRSRRELLEAERAQDGTGVTRVVTEGREIGTDLHREVAQARRGLGGGGAQTLRAIRQGDIKTQALVVGAGALGLFAFGEKIRGWWRGDGNKEGFWPKTKRVGKRVAVAVGSFLLLRWLLHPGRGDGTGVGTGGVPDGNGTRADGPPATPPVLSDPSTRPNPHPHPHTTPVPVPIPPASAEKPEKEPDVPATPSQSGVAPPPRLKEQSAVVSTDKEVDITPQYHLERLKTAEPVRVQILGAGNTDPPFPATGAREFAIQKGSGTKEDPWKRDDWIFFTSPELLKHLHGLHRAGKLEHVQFYMRDGTSLGTVESMRRPKTGVIDQILTNLGVPVTVVHEGSAKERDSEFLKKAMFAPLRDVLVEDQRVVSHPQTGEPLRVHPDARDFAGAEFGNVPKATYLPTREEYIRGLRPARIELLPGNPETDAVVRVLENPDFPAPVTLADFLQRLLAWPDVRAVQLESDPADPSVVPCQQRILETGLVFMKRNPRDPSRPVFLEREKPAAAPKPRYWDK